MGTSSRTLIHIPKEHEYLERHEKCAGYLLADIWMDSRVNYIYMENTSLPMVKMSIDKPLHKSNLLLKDLGGEFLIYSAEHKEIHVINPTAQLIWELCDGTHTIDEIAQELRAHYSISPESDVTADIHHPLNIFKSKDLLENEG